jgi:hypothetical protein
MGGTCVVAQRRPDLDLGTVPVRRRIASSNSVGNGPSLRASPSNAAIATSLAVASFDSGCSLAAITLLPLQRGDVDVFRQSYVPALTPNRPSQLFNPQVTESLPTVANGLHVVRGVAGRLAPAAQEFIERRALASTGEAPRSTQTLGHGT